MIPDYQSIMLPMLRVVADGHEHKYRDLIDALASVFALSEDERREPLASGQPIFDRHKNSVSCRKGDASRAAG